MATASAICAGSSTRVDHLAWLGVDVVWLSPVYQSPNDDNGYDISDYQDIMAEFGTMTDWEELLAALHARGIRLVMDLVVNHTSDEHPWFVESRQVEGQPLPRLLHLAPGQGRPRAQQLGILLRRLGLAVRPRAPASTTCTCSRRKQPDLNWENAEVRAAIWRMMRWWLDKGIDGFRMDVINLISKAPDLPDAPRDHRRPATSGAASISSTGRACSSSWAR